MGDKILSLKGGAFPNLTSSCKDLLHLSPEEEQTQEEAAGVEPQFLFHGYEMPRMLFSHHCL